MKKQLTFLFFVLSFIIINSQKKDTIFILLHDDIFSKSINDTLVYDNNAGSWINQNQIGKYIYLQKEIECYGENCQKDTILLGKNINKEYYKINKYIYPNDLEREKEKLKSYLQILDSCNNILKKDLSNLDKTITRDNEDKEKSKKYKCYHSNFKSNQIYLTPYIFWRNDSKSDSIKIIGKINTPKFKGDIKTNTRLYKTLAELEDICNRKNGNIKCYKHSRAYWPNMGFPYLEKLNLYDYIIYINEDFIPEYFPEDDKEKSRKIMLNEYHLNNTYHKAR
ncbi:hypothetical protein [Chryseobacterium mucoviscidosis]|uniref:hypothetical protein n=1 Tax=Chryseobacterium mucoviscidosis TaxID=1945581 RepID=UPI0031D4EA21